MSSNIKASTTIIINHDHYTLYIYRITAYLIINIRKSVFERRVFPVVGQLPRVVEDEHVVCPYAQQDEDGEYVEDSEVTHVQQYTIHEVGAQETRHYAEL